MFTTSITVSMPAQPYFVADVSCRVILFRNTICQEYLSLRFDLPNKCMLNELRKK